MAAPDPLRPLGPGSNQPWKPDEPTVAGMPSPVKAPGRPVVPGKPARPRRALPVATPLVEGVSAKQAAPQAVPASQPIARPVPLRPVGGPVPLVQTAAGDESAEAGEAKGGEVGEVVLKNAPPWLVSAALHMLMLIIFGLIVNTVRPPAALQLQAETVYTEHYGLQTAIDSPLGVEDTDKIEPPMLTPPNLKEVDDPFAAPTRLEIHPEGSTASRDMKSAPIGLALSGRQEGSRRTLLGKFGGNATTEGAVIRGLKWLARYQLEDGSWSLAGKYSKGAVQENREAATAMALLAFQGAGNTHQSGEFKKQVGLGWATLLKSQGPNGDFFQEGGFNHRFYTHGQCTIALCELYAMTKDEKLKSPAERAVHFIVKSQGPDGGWRYHPNTEGDMSVTGWIVMALQSARMAGLAVPGQTFAGVGKFLDRLAAGHDYRYPYQAGEAPSLPMTAEAMLCRQYLGWPRSDKRMEKACKWITQAENLVNFRKQQRDVYYWYYATQVCHHMEGEYWVKWNKVMRGEVPKWQEPGGKEAGSWDPERPSEDKWGFHGGRLYTTCLSIYMLEVYYRHLPLYSGIYATAAGATPAAEPAPKPDEKPEVKPQAKPEGKPEAKPASKLPGA